ncbi:VOC family protein [Nocardia brasiliensis]|uniref:VOC family protein n=1 Tax=Nocardia brasiliensis TaxID=37326 RepID=UPI0009DD589A|nr:VOC family protein [Nocardia brasiliensis]MBF6129906.1 VOC family protein [Nocardia brasiliensis]MBF6542353.1 VOC family protein [Nocardia brasiliensis]
MPIQMRAFMLGVRDLHRAKQFYAEGLGCEIDKDTRKFVALRLNDGALNLALYEWDAAAADAGVSAAGSGFRGASFHINPDSRAAVDEIMRTAVAAGAAVVKDPGPAEWGGYYGYFSDPDGYLWKVTTAGS